MAQGFPSLCQQGVGPFADGTYAGEQRVVSAVGPAEVAAFDGGVHSDAGALVALVGQGRGPGRGDRVQRTQAVGPRCRDVVGRARFHRGGPQREAGGVGDDLDVPAETFVLARIPGVVALLRPFGQPVGGNQGAVQGEVGQVVLLRGGQALVQVRGVGGQHIDALVQVLVGSGLGQIMIGGQCCYAGVAAIPAQYQFRLGAGRAGPLVRTGVMGAPVAVQQARQKSRVSIGTSQMAE